MYFWNLFFFLIPMARNFFEVNTFRVKYNERLYRTICRGQTAGSLKTLVSSTGLVFNFTTRCNG